MSKLKPNVETKTERYHLSGERLKEVVKHGFLALTDIPPGAEFKFLFEPEFNRVGAVIEVVTIVQPYVDSPEDEDD